LYLSCLGAIGATNAGQLMAGNIVSSNSISQSSSTATNVFMGRVGIGTSSPAEGVMLQVAGNIAGQGFIGSANGLTDINGGAIVPGSIPNSAIANNTISSVKIQDGTISHTDLATAAVIGTKIANGVVTIEKLNLGTIDPRYINAEGDVMTGNLTMSGTNSIINVQGIILSTNSGDVGMGVYVVKP